MEFVELYDKQRRKINKISSRDDIQEKGEYRQTVHVWIMNSKGEFLIQKRSQDRKRNPGLWAFTSGAVDKGETSLIGAVREVKEELGLDVDIKNIEFLLSFKKKYTIVDVWLIKSDVLEKELILQKEEVEEARWVSEEELKNLVKQEKFVKSFSFYEELFYNLLKVAELNQS